MARETKYPISIIIRAVNDATAELRKVNKEITTFGKDVTKIGKSISTALTVPIVGMGAAGVIAFGRIEKGMSNVATLIDTNTESLSAMTDEVLAIGRRVPAELDDLTGALYDVRSAGVAAADQFTVLENSGKLAVAGLGSTKEAVDLVTSSINAFGLEGETADQVYDQIFKTVKNGKTTISGLSQGFGAVAGTVAATGTELDEYLASVAALTTTGLPAAQAHTQLRQVISGLTRTTDQSRRVFRKLGAKDFKDLIAKSGGLVPALQKISDLAGGNEARILSLVGSTEALNAVIGLTGKQNEAYAETLKAMRDGTNAVEEAFVKQSQTMHSQLQRTKNAITAAAVSIGRVLAPAIESFANAVKWASDLLAGLDEGTRKWVVGIALLIAALGPAVMIVGKLAAGFVALKAALATVKILAVMIGTNLVIAIKTLSVALFTTPIGWIILGITALIGIGYLLIRNWDRVKAFLVSMWEGIKSAIGTFIGWVSSAFSAVVGAVMVVWEPLAGFFGKLWDGITGIFERAWAKIKAIVDKVTGAVETVTGAIGKVKSWVWGDDDKKSKRAGDKQGQMVERRAMLASRDPARMLGGQQSNTTVTVEFENAPRGLRVDQESSGAMVDLSVGYQMVMP